MEANGNITNKSETTQDVTLQYSDLESRKKSLTVEQERIWALLEKADTLESVIALEERLSEIRYQLESMESQLRLYDNQVTTVRSICTSMRLRRKRPLRPLSRKESAEAWERVHKEPECRVPGSDGFIIWFLAASPIWVPLAAAVIVILLILRRSKRRMQERLKSYVVHDEEKAEDTDG